MRATYHKLHAAYEALENAAKAAEYFDSIVIAETMTALMRASKQLSTQECLNCDAYGYCDVPDEPNARTVCTHPDILQYDIYAGKETT